MVEQRPFKALVASSSLARPTAGFPLKPAWMQGSSAILRLFIVTDESAKRRERAGVIGTSLALGFSPSGRHATPVASLLQSPPAAFGLLRLGFQLRQPVVVLLRLALVPKIGARAVDPGQPIRGKLAGQKSSASPAPPFQAIPT